MDEQYLKTIATGSRPIPGQSLTSDPNSPAAYEQAPEFTTINEASEYLFEKFIDEEVYPELMGVLDQGVPIMDVVQTTLFTGFTEGKWNPDLLMLLIEPTAYMLLGLAESADIDPVVYRDQVEDEFDEDFDADLNPQQEQYKKLAASLDIGKIEKVLPQEIVEQIEDVAPSPSLMKEPEQPMPDEGSLLAPPPVAEKEV